MASPSPIHHEEARDLRTTLKDNKTEQNPVRAEEPGFPHLSGTKKRILAREMLKSEILW
ncbi:MAG: hypothetical protein ACK41W_11305 [Cyanobacteriota bacterium]